jgi:predicted metal-dependent phosphoesterase TrpH
MHRARYDLHLHTEYSSDCDTALSAIEAHCRAHGVTGIAVTDHDTIEGALRLRDMAKSLRVIVGEEVTTRDGDVIGLFLKERIPPGMSALETMQAIHAQGGLVYLPHPFDKARARSTGGASLSAIIDHVDIVETFNGKAGRDRYNLLAAEFASRHHKIAGGGSDAHSLRAIGTVTNTFDAPEAFASPQEFLACLATAHLAGQRRSPIGGWLVRGRRPLSLAWRRLRHGKRHP